MTEKHKIQKPVEPIVPPGGIKLSHLPESEDKDNWEILRGEIMNYRNEVIRQINPPDPIDPNNVLWDLTVLVIVTARTSRLIRKLPAGTLVYDQYYLDKQNCMLKWVGYSLDKDEWVENANLKISGLSNINPPTGKMTINDFISMQMVVFFSRNDNFLISRSYE